MPFLAMLAKLALGGLTPGGLGLFADKGVRGAIGKAFSMGGSKAAGPGATSGVDASGGGNLSVHPDFMGPPSGMHAATQPQDMHAAGPGGMFHVPNQPPSRFEGLYPSYMTNTGQGGGTTPEGAPTAIGGSYVGSGGGTVGVGGPGAANPAKRESPILTALKSARERSKTQQAQVRRGPQYNDLYSGNMG